ncbi:MAG: aminomethyl-transferring glycine dehydrogenase [Bacteroidetes bacterium]|nr:aminomethyl-transferring glycine dehydrogenase [Bacteroidota bacterium]MBL6944052.1 aminomethyl-transferring glycine dehydrogenase [Bacteroidales bacterium]
MNTQNFINRHNGPSEADVTNMLNRMGLSSVDQLIDKTIPGDIRLKNDLNLDGGLSEYEYLKHIRKLSQKNKVFKSYIGMGYYNTIVPPVILRNVFENPGWYTSYTPYQAEISQGRLEALLNFQTMISDLTGLPIANSSLLDESTAAAEAMLMIYNSRPRTSVINNANVFLVSENMFPQTIAVLKTRAASKSITLKLDACEDFEFNDKVFGCMIQYPDQKGDIQDYREVVTMAKEKDIPISVASDLLSLTMLTPPGEWGADVVFGSSQRMGVPMGFGGPHAAFFATSDSYKRNIPGRIIGISKDRNGNRALRMALQTREQHIKRERATSNICTAQALLAIMAGFYGVYHGKDGLKEIAVKIHNLTAALSLSLEKSGYECENKFFFDTLYVKVPDNLSVDEIKSIALRHEINLRYFDDNQHIGISIDETVNENDIATLAAVFANAAGSEKFELSFPDNKGNSMVYLPANLNRKSDFMHHDVFNSYHSETEMMRYLKKLENKDLALNRSMIPLGSCTMKLNAVAEMMPISWPEFTEIHPFVPSDQAQGYLDIINEMNKILSEVTGFSAISFQPNSGAAGEYAGLLVIREYQKSIGHAHRNICLIPASAHGTNPASAVVAGLNVVVVKTADNGNIDIDDLKLKAKEYKNDLSAIMITYPSTHGIFEEGIRDVIKIVHKNGGQVYMDGANMNAQVGLTNPGYIGADVCHLNLHKTFGIPHGGGGPGVGPIGVAEHLVPFLPGHIMSQNIADRKNSSVSSAPFGSALVLLISYGYLKLLGSKGLTEATKMAILNANYMMEELKDHYPILYRGKNGCVGHEMILDCNQFSKTANVMVVDIAKRLMDYGFHAPTVAFPVHGTLMVEPTESEPLLEMNYFIEAMKTIREEIREIEEGKAEQNNNVVINAPHTAEMLIDNNWNMSYDREKAAYPLSWVRDSKYFTPVAKIDDAFGDRNLCTCLPIEKYKES